MMWHSVERAGGPSSVALSHSRGKINSERSMVRRGGVTLSGGLLPVPVRGRKPAWQTRGQAGVQASERASEQATVRSSAHRWKRVTCEAHTLSWQARDRIPAFRAVRRICMYARICIHSAAIALRGFIIYRGGARTISPR